MAWAPGPGATDLDEDGVVLPVLGFASIPGSRVLPVEVQAVEVVLAQESNRAPDEGLPASRVGDQRAEPSGAFVPASDGQQGLEVPVVGLQGRKLSIATWK